jgi:SAM-dependent methyltransferase
VGILAEPAHFITKLHLRAGFSVCELGDQWVTHTDPHLLAADFYRSLGCGRYVSIDGNGRGTLTWDLNLTLKKLGHFDLVTDFGTGEHIFDQAQVWRSIHRLTKPGDGYIAFDRPTQGYEGHCFYRVDESWFIDIATANEYRIVRLERATTKRGELVRGVFQRRYTSDFRVPQQGRYLKKLRPLEKK